MSEHMFTDQEAAFLLEIVTTKIAPRLEELAKGGLNYAFEEWRNRVYQMKEHERLAQENLDVQNIMRTSVRGSRSDEDREVLQRYLSRLSCIPKETPHHIMDALCNDIDWFPCIGRSILFLQGDFGNVYYIIAKGKVDLYLEKSKDREMVLGGEFGHLRGIPYEGTDEDLKALGTKIVTLEEGQGFGEFAILSTAAKLRMCAAVSATSGTFLFILHGKTYDLVLRQHHYRSKQLSLATSLLQELPIFSTYSHSKLSNAAYAMKNSIWQKTATIVRKGTKIEHVFLVHTGFVKAVAERDKLEASSADGVLNAQETLQNRLPQLATSILGRGSIIGEYEMLNKIDCFQMTYVSNAHNCEVFEMPISVYREMVMSRDMINSALVKKKKESTNQKAKKNQDRVARTETTMKKVAMTHARATDDKAQLLKLLPLLIDGVALDAEAVDKAERAKKSTHRHIDKTSQDFIDEHTKKYAGTRDMYGDDDVRGPESTTMMMDTKTGQSSFHMNKTLLLNNGKGILASSANFAPGGRMGSRDATPGAYKTRLDDTANTNIIIAEEESDNHLYYDKRAVSPDSLYRSSSRQSPRASRLLSASMYVNKQATK